MSTVVVRPRALADLAEIWAYIADDSPDQADAFARLINNKFRVLSRHPNMGRRRLELLNDVCSFAVGRYVIFYLPLAHGIDVVRVLHGARDVGSIFREDEG